MQRHRPGIESVIAAFILTGVCLLGFPVSAERAGQQREQGTVSDDDLVRLNQQIKELKDSTFRAFLRMRLLSWESPTSSPIRRQAAMEVASQGVRDLCDHQDEVRPPTASWLYEGMVKSIKTLQSPGETALEICVLKSETKNDSAKDFSAAIRMLKNPETSAAGLNLAKSTLLSGQVPAEAMMGQLFSLNTTHSPHLPELLSATLTLEEKQPGWLPLRLMPFLTSVFLDKSVPAEIQRRFMFVALRASQVSAAELSNPAVISPIRSLLNGIVLSAQQVAPELYPEILSRLTALNRNAPNIIVTRLAAEERIQKANDQLEQLISEANSASHDGLKTHFFFRAANLAKEQGQLSKAVDLATQVSNTSERENSSSHSWLSEFLSQVVSLALKKNSPRDATDAISKMTQHFAKARSFRLLGEYYGANKDQVKSKEAFTQCAKELKSVDISNEKVKTLLSLAESVLTYEPAAAYDAFRESVREINNLTSPEKDQEKIYYVTLLPVAEDLIRSFRLLATRENQTATNLAAEIKLSELRLSALIGAYSR